MENVGKIRLARIFIVSVVYLNAMLAKAESIGKVNVSDQSVKIDSEIKSAKKSISNSEQFAIFIVSQLEKWPNVSSVQSLGRVDAEISVTQTAWNKTSTRSYFTLVEFKPSVKIPALLFKLTESDTRSNDSNDRLNSKGFTLKVEGPVNSYDFVSERIPIEDLLASQQTLEFAFRDYATSASFMSEFKTQSQRFHEQLLQIMKLYAPLQNREQLSANNLYLGIGQLMAKIHREIQQ